MPEITDNYLTINGPPLPGITIKSGSYIPVMVVAANAMLSVDRLTITNATGFFVYAITNNGTLTVANSKFPNNNQPISNGGTLTVTNTTFSGSYTGNGIGNGGTATVTDSTFFNNGQSTLLGGWHFQLQFADCH